MAGDEAAEVPQKKQHSESAINTNKLRKQLKTLKKDSEKAPALQ